MKGLTGLMMQNFLLDVKPQHALHPYIYYKTIMLDILSNFNLSIRGRINIYPVYLKVSLSY